MAITIETSTDTPEEVRAALGTSVQIDESPAAEESETPEEKPTGTEEEPAETETEEETENKEEDEADEKDKEKPAKKAAPQMVPRSRLNEEIRKRKSLEKQMADRDDEPEEEETPVKPAAEPERPKFFSGLPEPKLEDFTKGVDKFDPEAMATAQSEFMKSFRVFDRAEARAEAAYDRQQEKVAEAQQELVADFLERRDAFKEANPERWKTVQESTVQLTALQEHFAYESEVGPEILEYFAEHPKEARRIGGMKARSQSKAMLELEDELIAELPEAEEKAEEPKPKGPPRKPITTPPKKPTAPPLPPNRLKPAGPGPQTLQELAGPTDNSGVSIRFNPEYEKAYKARQKA